MAGDIIGAETLCGRLDEEGAAAADRSELVLIIVLASSMALMVAAALVVCMPTRPGTVAIGVAG